MKELSRMNEWFVPKFGPLKFRAFVGMLFLPYTGMCVSFAIIGSLLSPEIMWDRVLAIFFIYFLSVGLSAHAADHLGSRKIKPWGSYFSDKELIVMTTLGISLAYATGIYYMVNYVPLLWPVSIAEGFFLFAYNLELFKGFFHNNVWFAISWGSLPVLAGYIIQTNSLSEFTVMVSAIAGIISYIEIRISRHYKELMMLSIKLNRSRKLESQLKILSLGTLLFTILLVCLRIVLDV
ncbi:MAG TPA: hypothetical protein VF884_07575 [Nitrososphaeraceae archaeon]